MSTSFLLSLSELYTFYNKKNFCQSLLILCLDLSSNPYNWDIFQTLEFRITCKEKAFSSNRRCYSKSISVSNGIPHLKRSCLKDKRVRCRDNFNGGLFYLTIGKDFPRGVSKNYFLFWRLSTKEWTMSKRLNHVGDYITQAEACGYRP